MIEFLDSRQAPDFKARYENTYGFVNTLEGKKKAVLITKVSSEGVTCVDDLGNQYYYMNDAGASMEFTQVPSRWFQARGGRILFVCRKPKRQWKRGVCDGNTSFMTIKNGGLSFVPFSTCRLEEIFYPYQQEDNPFEGDPSWPTADCGVISPLFAWHNKRVYVKTLEIGSKEKDNIKLDSDLFKQELEDAIRRKGLNFIVQ